jgi:hypothetical protein
MSQTRNFFARALDAVMEGRQRQAERYIAQYQRDLGQKADPLTKR